MQRIECIKKVLEGRSLFPVVQGYGDQGQACHRLHFGGKEPHIVRQHIDAGNIRKIPEKPSGRTRRFGKGCLSL